LCYTCASPPWKRQLRYDSMKYTHCQEGRRCFWVFLPL